MQRYYKLTYCFCMINMDDAAIATAARRPGKQLRLILERNHAAAVNIVPASRSMYRSCSRDATRRTHNLMPLIASLPVRRCLRLFALLLPLLAAARPAFAADEDFLPVRSAYKVALSASPDELVVRFDIADGYYLYRDRLGFESATPGVTLGKASLPVGLDHEDEFFGKQIIYRDTIRSACRSLSAASRRISTSR